MQRILVDGNVVEVLSPSSRPCLLFSASPLFVLFLFGFSMKQSGFSIVVGLAPSSLPSLAAVVIFRL